MEDQVTTVFCADCGTKMQRKRLGPNMRCKRCHQRYFLDTHILVRRPYVRKDPADYSPNYRKPPLRQPHPKPPTEYLRMMYPAHPIGFIASVLRTDGKVVSRWLKEEGIPIRESRGHHKLPEVAHAV